MGDARPLCSGGCSSVGSLPLFFVGIGLLGVVYSLMDASRMIAELFDVKLHY